MQDGDNDLLSSLDDLDPFTSRRPAGGPRPSKFQPKLKGKVKSEPPANPKALPVTVKSEDVAMVKKDEDVAMVKKEEEVAMVKKDEDLAMVKQDEPLHNLMIADNAIVPAADDPMDTECDDEEEDRVVHEIDVFFSPAPLDEDTLLYVMQHPLRPSWRPYELNERCEEVRVKPKQSKIEVDLSPVVTEGSYNPDVLDNLNFKKQTLSSSKAPFVTDYAVGIMVGNQLHLNPVHAVVQLRHSKAYISSGLQKKKQSGRSREGNTSEENLEGSSKLPVRQKEKKVLEDLNEDIDDSEPWIPLEYHATDSVLSGRYKQKMVAEEYDCIQFAMTPSDFVLSLCPGITTSRNVEVPPSWVFDSLPLEEHLRRWLTEVSQVSRFNVIKHFSPANSSDEEVLMVLQLYAYLVQGLWVSKSSLVCSVPQKARARDFFLLLFSKNRVVPMKRLKASSNISDDLLKEIMPPLATARPKLGDWKFREDTDESFIKRFPHIVEEQNRAWSAREKDIMDSLRARPAVTKPVPVIPIMVKKADITGKVDPVTNEGKDGSFSSTSTTSTMLSNEAREALPKALSKLFQQQKVLSLSSITRGLRERALKKSSLRKDDQEREIFVIAANGVCASLPDVKLLISELAVDIHGLYVLKSDEKTETGQLRNIVINLFLKREPNAKLQKQEIIDAAKLFLKRDISDSEYHQVMNELCVNNKGSWSLKSGDMNAK